jgi:hypothetical protein
MGGAGVWQWQGHLTTGTLLSRAILVSMINVAGYSLHRWRFGVGVNQVAFKLKLLIYAFTVLHSPTALCPFHLPFPISRYLFSQGFNAFLSHISNITRSPAPFIQSEQALQVATPLDALSINNPCLFFVFLTQ